MKPQTALGLLVLVTISFVKDSSEFPTKDCGIWNPQDKNVPWAVGIYSNKAADELKLVCQGTVIMDNIIVTSAHCVCGLFDNKVVTSLSVSNQIQESLQLGPGVVKVDPSDIHCHKEYKGFLFYPYADIAVIKVPKLIFDDHKPTPVCVDWSDINVPTIQELKNGLLPIWDIDVKLYNALFLDGDTCSAFASEDFLYVLDNDKICLKTEPISHDEKNIGAGLVIKNPSDASYYLDGVLSYVDGDNNRKGKSTPIAATSVRQYINWLSNICAKV